MATYDVAVLVGSLRKANHHLRQSLVFLNMPTLQQPEAYIGGADRLFDGDGFIASTREFFTRYLQAFSVWVERNAAAS
jgi:chromate reductase, NAD(P)H dehydrogenase (quinone)